VRFLEDVGQAPRLTELINDVYAVAESGMWVDGAQRTTVEAMRALIAAGEIVVTDGGVVRVRRLSADRGEFGMLAADPARRGEGIGRALVAFAEQHCAPLGTMQLELLVPRDFKHPSKVFLDEWYRRLGYRVVRRTRLAEFNPELEPLLATPCELLIYEKALPAAA
jgi:GNAT superfamily N-acetyltransferase